MSLTGIQSGSAATSYEQCAESFRGRRPETGERRTVDGSGRWCSPLQGGRGDFEMASPRHFLSRLRKRFTAWWFDGGFADGWQVGRGIRWWKKFL